MSMIKSQKQQRKKKFFDDDETFSFRLTAFKMPNHHHKLEIDDGAERCGSIKMQSQQDHFMQLSLKKRCTPLLTLRRNSSYNENRLDS